MTYLAPKFLLLGGLGQVGQELRRSLSVLGELEVHNRHTLDVTHHKTVRKIIENSRADFVINATAWTAVDRAETEREAAFAVNANAVENMTQVCKDMGAVFVHYSTDYVFDGWKTGAYTELDVPNPQSAYGQSKLAGEIAAQQHDRSIIFRTSWIYGENGANFVRTLLKLAKERDSLTVVADQFGAPTAASLIADATAHALAKIWRKRHSPERRPDFGLYHLTASGATTWHEFARAIVETARLGGLQTRLDPDEIIPIPSSEYPLPASRPANSRLDCSKLRDQFGLHLPNWRHALPSVVHALLREQKL